jgi:hypothetical protein
MNYVVWILVGVIGCACLLIVYLIIKTLNLETDLDAANFKRFLTDAENKGLEARKKAESENATGHMLRLRELFKFKPKS